MKPLMRKALACYILSYLILCYVAYTKSSVYSGMLASLIWWIDGMLYTYRHLKQIRYEQDNLNSPL